MNTNPKLTVIERKSIALDPNLPGVHYELAETILESGRSDAGKQREAESQIQAAMRTDGNTARIECLLGRIAFERSDLPRAFAHYSKALSLNSIDVEAQLGLGRVFMAMQKPQEARKHLELAVQSDPLNGEAHYRLAVTLRNLQLNAESQKEMRLFQEIKKTKDQVKELYRQMNKSPDSQNAPVDKVPTGGGNSGTNLRPRSRKDRKAPANHPSGSK